MFQSATYWGFLLAAFTGFWLAPRAVRLPFLAAASFLYLLWLDPMGLCGLALWIVVFLAIGKTNARSPLAARLVLPAILAILAYLAYYKYVPGIYHGIFDTDKYASVVAPLGISFITFRLIHYIVESGRGHLPPYSATEFLAYALLFPIWTAGPIHRFDKFLTERSVDFDRQDVLIGLNRIINGIIKKFVLADQLLPRLYGDYSNARLLIDNLSNASTIDVWWFLIISFLILYMDFSGYSDMAIGSARLFGIRVLENFNFPILAKNISEYWKRWHMTLAGWCQNYIYMPVIGQTRNPYLAVFSTFIVMGAWHAGSWHWILWGMHHAVGITIHRLWGAQKKNRGWTFFQDGVSRHLAIPLTLLYVCAAGVFTTVHGVGTVSDSFLMLEKAFIPSRGLDTNIITKRTGD